MLIKRNDESTLLSFPRDNPRSSGTVVERKNMEKNMKCMIAGLMSVFVCSGISASPKPQPEKVLALKGTVIEAGTGKPLEFVTVALADTGTYSIRISDRSRSSMTNRLVFSLVGYKEQSFSFLDLEPEAGGRQEGAGFPECTVRGGVMELGPVALEEDTQMLECWKGRKCPVTGR